MSSFFDEASLVMIPSGYKDQKVYSVKPLDGSGDLAFTRASNATRVASNGLIEKVRTNVALYSEQFDNAAYTKLDATVTANAVANPLNGAVTADKIVENTANSLHRVGQGAISVTSGVPITFSFIAKAGERTQLEVQRINTSGTVFNALSNNIINLTTGVVPVITGATSYGSVSLGNGWFRYYITLTPIASATGGLNLGLVDGSGNVSYTGDGTSGAFVFGFQAEIGDVMTDYIATTSAAVSVGPVSGLPRLDYLNSSCPRLLLEPSRTSLVTFSEQMDNAVWTKSEVTVSANAAISPDGYANSDKIVPSVNNATHFFLQNSSVTSGTAYTMSLFAKADGYSFLQIANSGGFSVASRANFDLSNGTVGSNDAGTATITNYGNGWYRLSYTLTADSTTTAGRFVVAVVNSGTAARLAGFVADGTSGVLIYGCQFEAGAYATSYIPSLNSATTRVADAASKTGISSLIGQTEGTIFFQFQNLLLSSYPSETIFQIVSGTNQLWARKESGGNTYTIRLIVGGVTIWTFASVTIPNGNSKLAVSYKTGDSAIFLNGTQVGSTNTASFSSSSFADLNFNLSGGGFPYLPLNQALLFKTRLTNAQLAELTSL